MLYYSTLVEVKHLIQDFGYITEPELLNKVQLEIIIDVAWYNKILKSSNKKIYIKSQLLFRAKYGIFFQFLIFSNI